jgi:hypothetical protein
VYLLRKCKYVLIDVIKRTPRQLKKLVKSGFTPEVAEYVQINFVLKFFKIMEMQGLQTEICGQIPWLIQECGVHCTYLDRLLDNLVLLMSLYLQLSFSIIFL